MPDAFNQGIQSAVMNQGQVRNEVATIAINWFVNRTPLVARLPRVPVGSTQFTLVNRKYRPKVATTAASYINTDTTITLADASGLMLGDVLETPSGDRMEITADPNVSSNVITVRRGAEGTTAAGGNSSDVFKLIGNSRFGNEVNQNAISFNPSGINQYCQTWQHAVQVGGSLQASTAFVAAPGGGPPFEQYKMDALQNLMDDMEISTYYGIGEAPTGTARPKQLGVRQLIKANAATNYTSAPTNAGAYKPSDLIRDTVQLARTGGGDPDVLLVDQTFISGLATWGSAAQRLDAGENVFGTPIDVFEVPFLGGLQLIECMFLRPGTAVALTSSEVRMRMKRNEFWNPRGIRGDAFEGDFIGEGAVEVDNFSHHAWVEGITAFSAT